MSSAQPPVQAPAAANQNHSVLSLMDEIFGRPMYPPDTPNPFEKRMAEMCPEYDSKEDPEGALEAFKARIRAYNQALPDLFGTAPQEKTPGDDKRK